MANQDQKDEPERPGQPAVFRCEEPDYQHVPDVMARARERDAMLSFDASAAALSPEQVEKLKPLMSGLASQLKVLGLATVDSDCGNKLVIGVFTAVEGVNGVILARDLLGYAWMQPEKLVGTSMCVVVERVAEKGGLFLRQVRAPID